MADMAVRIRRARRGAGLSQADLASLLGINRSAVAQWERSGGCKPTAGNLAKLAIATKLNFEWLATGRGRMSAEPAGETHALRLDVYAHDEMEERVLLALRKLPVWQAVAIAELVETLGRGKLNLRG